MESNACSQSLLRAVLFCARNETIDWDAFCIVDCSKIFISHPLAVFPSATRTGRVQFSAINLRSLSARSGSYFQAFPVCVHSMNTLLFKGRYNWGKCDGFLYLYLIPMASPPTGFASNSHLKWKNKEYPLSRTWTPIFIIAWTYSKFTCTCNAISGDDGGKAPNESTVTILSKI